MNSTSSSPSRSFLSRTLARRKPSQKGKGPFGLNTLHEPLDSAIADLIFVHGLGGGSQSTWTKSGDPSLFWPQEWLPHDAGFKDVRIHSFGYNSNWDKKSTLNIHDFAKSLLGSIQDCPAIPRYSSTPLIFVGHSMGGLVIKRAYIFAQQSQDFESLAQRVHSIFFLATPHRGADLAALLTRILNITPGARPFVQDLHRNSLSTQSINDEFPQHCQNLRLYSFYETLPTNYGLGKGLVVDKDLAILGYANERTAYVNANHREICKYPNRNDPNYLIVRNALASAIETLRDNDHLSKRGLNKERSHLLNSFLGVSDVPEDDFMGVDTRRIRGSCEWLVERESFLSWRDSTNSQIYWISAKPATGKSVLSGYIIKHLRDLNQDCLFYFFHSDDRVKATISSFLRSIAWQMASMYPEILETVLDLCEKHDQLANADYRTLWRKLFRDGIFGLKVARPQYWVIDALDECKNYPELVPLLLKASEICQVRILITSRNKFASQGQTLGSAVQVVSEEILEEDTRRDIALYLEAYMDSLPSVGEEARQTMVAKILAKSAGCFLWVSLVLQELRQVHTPAEISKVLEDVPADMDELYSRILNAMSIAPYGKVLAKAILTWCVCSARPLSTEELYYALQLDIKDNIDQIEKSIAASCGQLVFVDAHSRVHMVHQTARDFLLRSPTVSEFGVDRKLGHKRLGMTCLAYLSSNAMKGPRHCKLSLNNTSNPRCAFVAYACSSLVEHVAHVSSTDDDFLFALAKFLSSPNVLSWIEYLAQNSNLACLIRTGRSFRKFLQRRSRHVSPFGKEVVLLDSWATDLVRLVTKFGKNLSTSPSSILYLIPPFCPPDSAPRKQFGASPRGIAVLGLSTTAWDDCLSTINHPQEQLTALACSRKHFSIGLSSGKVIVYHEMTCQEAQTLQHQEIVKILQFSETGETLVSAGMRAINLWDVKSWQKLWTLDITQDCMSLAFTDNDRLLLGALKNNYFMIWDLTTGVLIDSANWTDDLESQHSHSSRRPLTACFSVESSLLAIVYRGQDIVLWDIERNALYGTYNKEGGAHQGTKMSTGFVTGGLVFGHGPSSTLLAASYSDGELVLFDTFEGAVKEKTLAYAQTLASSPDGRTIACGDSAGTIQLYDFETLKLLYRINSDEYAVKALAFSGDNYRLLDIRGSDCRVWDPTVLVRQEADDANSDTISISTAPQEMRLESSEEVVLITSLVCHEKGEELFCGKNDGSIWMYEAKSGRQLEKLFSHANGVSIIGLVLDHANQILSSIDSPSRVMAHCLTYQQKSWRASKTTFDHRIGVAVDQLLSNRGNTRMLVCSTQKDILYSVTPQDSTVTQVNTWEDRGPYRWASHPSNENQLILIFNNTAHLYDWNNLKRLTRPEGIILQGSLLAGLSIRSINQCALGSLIVASFCKSFGLQSKSKALLWNTSDFSTNAESAASLTRYEYLSDQVQLIIGSYRQKLVFLDNDGWICSVNLSIPSIPSAVRHFFIPRDWLNAIVDLMIEVISNGDIIFVKRHEVAVIKRGLETSEQGPIATGQRGSLVPMSPRSPLSPGPGLSFMGREKPPVFGDPGASHGVTNGPFRR